MEIMKEEKASLAVQQAEMLPSILSSHIRKEYNCQKIEMKALTREASQCRKRALCDVQREIRHPDLKGDHSLLHTRLRIVLCLHVGLLDR